MEPNQQQQQILHANFRCQLQKMTGPLLCTKFTGHCRFYYERKLHTLQVRM